MASGWFMNKNTPERVKEIKQEVISIISEISLNKI